MQQGRRRQHGQGGPSRTAALHHKRAPRTHRSILARKEGHFVTKPSGPLQQLRTRRHRWAHSGNGGSRAAAGAGVLLMDMVREGRSPSPGPAVVPPTAASALEKKVAMFCSLAVGGSPPTYTLRACRVACWEGPAAANAAASVRPAGHGVRPRQVCCFHTAESQHDQSIVSSQPIAPQLNVSSVPHTIHRLAAHMCMQ